MTSVEGMWLLRSNEVGAEDQLVAPSVITLETGRLFGGDSAFYYIGDYQVDNGQIVGKADVTTHTVTEDLENVFGVSGPVNHTVSFEGVVTEDLLEGSMQSSAMPGVTLVWRMRKLANLP